MVAKSLVIKETLRRLLNEKLQVNWERYLLTYIHVIKRILKIPQIPSLARIEEVKCPFVYHLGSLILLINEFQCVDLTLILVQRTKDHHTRKV